jgi:hypothetical protein
MNSVCDSADNPMDRYCNEPALADVRSDPVTLAVMDGDGVNPRDVAATLVQTAGKRTPSLGTIDQNNRSIGSTIAKVDSGEPLPAPLFFYPRCWRIF